IVLMKRRILFDDLATLSDVSPGAPFTDSLNADQPEIVRLSRFAGGMKLSASISDPSALASDQGFFLCVTTDAGLGAWAAQAGGRRIQHEALLAVALAESSSQFCYFLMTVAPDELANAFDALRAAGAVLVYKSAAGELIGIAEGRPLNSLILAGGSIAKLGAAGLPDSHDLYLMRDAGISRAGFAAGAEP